MKKITKLILILSIFGIGCSLLSPNTYQRRINQGEFYYEFEVLQPSRKATTLEGERAYFHFEKIHVGHTSSDMWLLHGKYTKFNIEGKILEKGTYSKGTKEGIWYNYETDSTITTDYSIVSNEDKKPKRNPLHHLFKKDTTTLLDNDTLAK